jgi:hypothetical protein
MNRAADVTIAGLGLFAAAPVLALGALAVKLGDGGPVLYRHMRVGLRPTLRYQVEGYDAEQARRLEVKPASPVGPKYTVALRCLGRNASRSTSGMSTIEVSGSICGFLP